jgi:hypothetical protein
MNLKKNVARAICLAALSIAALYTGVLSADTTTVLNCSASCGGLQQGCCAESTGQCKYRSSTAVSWQSGSVENGNCVINGRVVGKMPITSIDPDKGTPTP